MHEAATSRSDQVRRVSVREAARLLNVSPSTVHRMIHRGTLQAETVKRPQGIATKVLIRPGDVPPHPAVRFATAQVMRDGGTSQSDTAHAPLLLPAERAEAMARYNAELVGPLVDQIDRLGRRVEELATENGRHVERISWLEAELQRFQAPQPEPMPTEPTPAVEAMLEPARRAWWRRFW